MKKEEIELIATRMAEEAFPYPITRKLLVASAVKKVEDMIDRERAAFKAAILEMLPLHMESLRLLKKLHRVCDCVGHHKGEYHHGAEQCPVEAAIEAHITSLEGLVKP